VLGIQIARTKGNAVGLYFISVIGKSVMEMRIAAALLITNFDFSFAPEEDSESVLTKATDFFTAAPGPLKLVLRCHKSDD
jgi:hypothetical protein